MIHFTAMVNPLIFSKTLKTLRRLWCALRVFLKIGSKCRIDVTGQSDCKAFGKHCKCRQYHEPVENSTGFLLLSIAMQKEIQIKEQQLMLEYMQTESRYKREMIFEQLCRLMKPIIVTSVKRHLSFIPKYEREDYYQIGYIKLWQILERLRETKRNIECFSAYIWAAMRYTFIGEFYKYISKNPTVNREWEDFRQNGLVISVRSTWADYLEKYKEKRRAYQREYRARKKRQFALKDSCDSLQTG